MADRLWRCQVSIPLDSAIPEDAIVNTWHFDDDDDPVAAPEDTAEWIFDLMRDFYTAVDGAVFPSTVSNVATMKLYDMAIPAVDRELLYSSTITLSPSADAPLPNEVALCLSMKAADSPGVNPARRRGRIYLGPVKNTALEVIDSQARPTSAVRTAVAGAAAGLQAGFEHPASPGLRLRWSIYSPTTDIAGTVGESFNDVLSGWVDNSFDTQRRRGCAPTSRTTF